MSNDNFSDLEDSSNSGDVARFDDEDEEVLQILKNRKRKARVIDSDSEESEDEDEEEDETLDRSTSDSGSSSSEENQDFTQRKYGKLSNNYRQQVSREELIDWLKEVEKDPSAGREILDVRRKELETAAHLRQEDRDQMDLQFDVRIPGSSVKGFYVVNASGKRNRLSSYYAAVMRSGVSQAKTHACSLQRPGTSSTPTGIG
ncbi:uncharacterized protein LOC118436533 isoform X2 [Folsomia candida]|uniref:uncharacterized protein LOC118436533 isoform X2 n=1 Tax=Folsomia candida TaxID=158441 RepID=UPI001604B811|nr:uncharacterized protein LOC118436533 isoform X2 [Folsomia candida]